MNLFSRFHRLRLDLLDRGLNLFPSAFQRRLFRRTCARRPACQTMHDGILHPLMQDQSLWLSPK